jgi:subtilase family serine protease
MFCSTCGHELNAAAQAAGACPACGAPIVFASMPPALPPEPTPGAVPVPEGAPPQATPPLFTPPEYPSATTPEYPAQYPPPAPPWQPPTYQGAQMPEDSPRRGGLIATILAVVAVILVLLLIFALIIPKHSTSSIAASATATLPPQPTSILNGGGGNGGGNGGGGVVQPLSVAQFRTLYGFDKLIAAGHTGKGQTIVDIVSFGAPDLQQDVDAFDQLNNLPAITIKVLSPLGTATVDPTSKDQQGWAGETTLDVEIMHALAPDAGIVVLTSPVSETEGTVGLPQFLQLEQYAFNNHLGAVVSQSWGASEATLADSAGQAEIQQWDTFLHQTTLQGITYLAGSGDNGAADYTDLNGTVLSDSPTSSFPNDDPWVTAVGGTEVVQTGNGFSEQAWNGSGGGFSAFYSTPNYQQTVASSSSGAFKGKRGIPDVSADAAPRSGMMLVIGGIEQPAGGTSASTPVWAALVAIANQMAGHTLGFINPALYKVAASSSNYAADFYDVTNGSNMVQGNSGVFGYSTGTGWDAVTGLGTPNAPALIPNLISAAATAGTGA